MALLFPRLAQNFAKNGYYPTDSSTLERILSFIQPLDDGMSQSSKNINQKAVCKTKPKTASKTQILDPCAGEGVALAEIKHRLSETQTTAYGIEFNSERAYHAKSLLDVAIHGDTQDCIFKRNQFGLLFLNPPYGDMASDQAQLSRKQFAGRERLEKLFYQHTFQSLVFGGLLVLIIPDYTLDASFAEWLSKHFCDIEVYRAMDQQFKQLVIFGTRQRVNQGRLQGVSNHDVKKAQSQLLEHDDIKEIPLLDEPRFSIPAIHTDQPLVYTQLDETQLTEELKSMGSLPGLWQDFDTVFSKDRRSQRRPLTALSDWHLALALAAGQVTGEVVSDDGESSVLIKGNTHKAKRVSTTLEEQPDGSFREISTHTDQFVSVIKGIDTTRGSTYGDIVTFR